jgi:hypothetical protein
MTTMKAQGDLGKLMDAKMASLKETLNQSLESLKAELYATMESKRPEIEASFAPSVEASPPDVEAIAAVEPAPVSMSADKGMRIADQLDKIVDSLKMGCLAGDVLDGLNEAKTEIMKIVPSDAIMVKIDKWAGVVSGYSKRHQIQAKDILKLKKEIKDEIPKYRPA